MTIKAASIKYGISEEEIRGLVKTGIVKRISKQNIDEADVERYYNDFWDTYANKNQLDKIYYISGTKLNSLCNQGKIRRCNNRNGLFFKSDYIEWVNSEDRLEYERKLKIQQEGAKYA